MKCPPVLTLIHGFHRYPKNGARQNAAFECQGWVTIIFPGDTIGKAIWDRWLAGQIQKRMALFPFSDGNSLSRLFPAPSRSLTISDEWWSRFVIIENCARLAFHKPGKPPTAQVAIFTAILATEGERLVVYDLFTSALLAVISNLSLARYWLGLRSVI